MFESLSERLAGVFDKLRGRGALNELEVRHAGQFMRIHRNALIARRAVRALEKHFDSEEGEGWAVRLNGIDELLAVSRRQLGAVREAIVG